MSNRHQNKLPGNLPQLQNVIKREPENYKDEVRRLNCLNYIVLVLSLNDSAGNISITYAPVFSVICRQNAFIGSM